MSSRPVMLSVIFLTSASSMTLYEIAKQFIFGSKLTLWQSHVITILFTSIIATVIAGILEKRLHEQHESIKELEVLDERQKTHKAMLQATSHYINNALNQLQVFTMELEAPGTFDQSILDEAKKAIRKSSRDISELSMMENPSHESIKQFLKERL